MRATASLVVIAWLGCAPAAPLRVCWVGHEARYVCDGDEGTPLRWEREVVLPYYVTMEEWQPAVHDGFALWNRELGRRIFVPTSDARAARVVIVKAAQRRNEGGTTRHRGGVLGPESARVEIRWPACSLAVMWIVAHEAGHVLGMRENVGGVMGSVPADVCQSERAPWLAPETSEVRLVRALYTEREVRAQQ